MSDASNTNTSVPECPSYVAHPQAVWFHEHWRPIIVKLQRQKEVDDILFWELVDENKRLKAWVASVAPSWLPEKFREDRRLILKAKPHD